MPTFNFSLISKKEKKRTTINNTISYEIIEKKVQGVIHIDINANYYINVKGNKYNIKKECYSCKDKPSIYIIQGTKRIRYIRCFGNYHESNLYLPFTYGLIAIGNIVRDKKTNNKYFDIKNCYSDIYNHECNNARKFYYEHSDVIYKIIKEKYINAIK